MPVKILLGFDPPKKSRAVHVFTSPRFFHIKLAASILFLPVIILNYYYRSSINESEEKIPRLGCLQ